MLTNNSEALSIGESTATFGAAAEETAFAR